MSSYETAHESAVRLTDNGEKCRMGLCVDCPMAKARRMEGDGCLAQAYVDIVDVNEQEKAFYSWRVAEPLSGNYNGKLKPCPFCGDSGQMSRVENCAYIVRCRNTKCPAARMANYSITVQSAAEKWNKRI